MTPHLGSDRDNLYHHWLRHVLLPALLHLPVLHSVPTCHLAVSTLQRQTPVRRHLHGSHNRIKSLTKDKVSQASQSSFCHRQLSCQTALPMQHFSSLKPTEILNVLAQTFRYSFIHTWNRRSTCNRICFSLPNVNTVIRHNTRLCRSDTIVSTLISDRDNKIIICTAVKSTQQAVILSTLPFICNIKLSKNDEYRSQSGVVFQHVRVSLSSG